MYKKIEKYAKKKGMNINQVAKKSGVAQCLFANMKSRDGDLSFRNALKVAKVLGVKMEDLA